MAAGLLTVHPAAEKEKERGQAIPDCFDQLDSFMGDSPGLSGTGDDDGGACRLLLYAANGCC